MKMRPLRNLYLMQSSNICRKISRRDFVSPRDESVEKKSFFSTFKIAIGADHGGFELKEKLVRFLRKENCKVKDFGTNSLDSCDYPEFGIGVSRGVSEGKFDRGILICKTGVGFCIVANKFPRVRAVVCYNTKVAKLSRQHNDANVLIFGSRFINFDKAKKVLDIWLNTSFDGNRHARRVEQIIKLENRLLK